jgi:hypothetical protein
LIKFEITSVSPPGIMGRFKFKSLQTNYQKPYRWSRAKSAVKSSSSARETQTRQKAGEIIDD